MAAKTNSTKNKTNKAHKIKPAAPEVQKTEKPANVAPKLHGKSIAKPQAKRSAGHEPAKSSPAAKLKAATDRKSPAGSHKLEPHKLESHKAGQHKASLESAQMRKSGAVDHHAKSSSARPVATSPQPGAIPSAMDTAQKTPVQTGVRPSHAAPTPTLPPRPVLAPGHRQPGHGPSLGHKRTHGFGQSQTGQLPRDVIERNPTLKLDPNKKKTLQRHGFRTSEYVVYPSHGVGKIVAIEEQVVAGHALELFVINFEQEKMTLRVPTAKLAAVGMRKLSEDNVVRRAMETLKGRARIKRTMWSRRAQEYETKINSGDLVSISEVVRDLYRAETQPEQSYSERQLFEAALDRMSREIAAIEKLDERGAVQKITEVLSKSAKGRAATKAAEDAASNGGEAGEGQAA